VARADHLKQQSGKRGKCRIIAGRWRGRVLKFDDADGLRPTTDRIRETVFNWLQVYLPNSHCLDCFAGSGVLGFEALSRGADEVTFLEQNKQTVNSLKENASMLAADEQQVIIEHRDALFWLRSVKTEKNLASYFDLVFLDPPFHSDLLNESCTLLNDSGCLAKDAIIYVEHELNANVEIPESWTCLKDKSSGQVTYKLFTNTLTSSRD
jgi:16S rRNA (guanine966-N2)-methyltransferase